MSNGLLKPQHLCTHPNGYLSKSNRCPDCNALAMPSVQIEHAHQQILKAYVDTQTNGVVGGSVNVPGHIMALTRIAAVEQYLERQAQLAIDSEAKVKLQ
jgi:hypothetical protein